MVSDVCVRHESSRYESDRQKTLTKAQVNVEVTRSFNSVFTREEGSHANECLLGLLGNGGSFEWGETLEVAEKYNFFIGNYRSDRRQRKRSAMTGQATNSSIDRSVMTSAYRLVEPTSYSSPCTSVQLESF